MGGRGDGKYNKGRVDTAWVSGGMRVAVLMGAIGGFWPIVANMPH